MDNDLHKPLLGDSVDDDNNNIDTTNLKRPKNNDKCRDEDNDDVRSVWFLCSLKVMGSDDDDDEDDDDLEKNLFIDDDEADDCNRNDAELSTSSKWYWNCFISSILPLLLYFQFYITYHYNDSNDSEAFESSSSMILMTNDWSSIQWSIFLFVVTSVLYRQSMAYHKSDSSSSNKNSVSYCELLLHLVPDIIIDILLILILFHYYIAAVLVMQLSTIFLAVNAILNSCNCSIYVGTTSHEIN
jgi:hypothetical protein